MVDDRMVKIVITNNMSDVQNKKQTNKKKRGKQESGRRDTEDIKKDPNGTSED